MNSELTIFHPSDPLGRIVGGAEFFINGIVQYAPKDINIRFVGISADPLASPPGKWRKAVLGSKLFDFLPILSVKSENRRAFFPLSLRYTLTLTRYRKLFSQGTLLFNRVEPAILFRNTDLLKIAIVHNDILQQISKKGGEVLWSRFPFLYFAFEKCLFKSLDHVFTVSEKTLEFYRNRYSNLSTHFKFTPTYVDTNFFHPSKEDKVLIRQRLISQNKNLPSHDKKWILFVGRLQPQKDPALLINSFYQHLQMNASSCLIIVGEGNERLKMEKLAEKLSIGNRVFFTGALHRKIISEFYQAADALLLTSKYEGMPMCVLEALGSGLPVISTDTGEIKKVVRDGYSGEIPSSFKAEDIARSLEKVLRNPHQYQTENCVACVKDYTPESVLDPFFQLIRQTR